MVFQVAEQILGAGDFAGEHAREKSGERLLACRGEVSHRSSSDLKRGGQGRRFPFDVVQASGERTGAELGAGSFRIFPQDVDAVGCVFR